MDKPTCRLIGADSNIFNLIGIATLALKRAGQDDKAKEIGNRCLKANGYQHALSIILEYVDQEQEEEYEDDEED